MAKKGGHLLKHIFYSFFLLLSGVFLIVAAAAPFWLLERVPSDEDTGPACGIFSSCQDQKDLQCKIEVYGDNLASIPTQALKVAAGMMIAAMAIVWLSFLFSILTCCFCYKITKLQIPLLTIASLLMLGTLLAFGYAFEDFNAVTYENNDLDCNCGDSDKFNQGSCRLGYGAGLGIAATVLITITGCIAESVKRSDIENEYYE